MIDLRVRFEIPKQVERRSGWQKFRGGSPWRLLPGRLGCRTSTESSSRAHQTWNIPIGSGRPRNSARRRRMLVGMLEPCGGFIKSGKAPLGMSLPRFRYSPPPLPIPLRFALRSLSAEWYAIIGYYYPRRRLTARYRDESELFSGH